MKHVIFLTCVIASGIHVYTGMAAAGNLSSPDQSLSPGPRQETGHSDIGGKQMNLIRARIFSRIGNFGKALALYRILRKDYPGDIGIWEEYIEILVNRGDYEPALAELTKLIEKDPFNLRAMRMEARIYMELERTWLAFPIYEDITHHCRPDADIWGEFAMIKQSSGEWAEALNYYSRVLEIDPERETARKAVHTILKAHRPRLETGYRRHSIPSADGRIDTFSLHHTRHMTQNAKLGLDYERVAIERPRNNKALEETILDLNIRFGRSWEGRLAMGSYSGLGGGRPLRMGMGHMIWKGAWMRAMHARRTPWYDPLEAAAFNGFYNRTTLSLNWNFEPGWGVYLGAEKKDHIVENDLDYGSQESVTAILTRRLLNRPEFYLSYACYRSRFRYDHDDFRPVSMIESEESHGLSWYLSHRLRETWTFGFSGSIRTDVRRSVNSWNMVPGFRASLGNRMEFAARYEYASDSGTTAGGATKTVYIETKIVF